MAVIISSTKSITTSNNTINKITNKIMKIMNSLLKLDFFVIITPCHVRHLREMTSAYGVLVATQEDTPLSK